MRPCLGWYYLLECSPDADPRLMKVGWTNHPLQRWQQHRRQWPGLAVVRLWPCHSHWERVVTVAVTRGCVLAENSLETFRVDSPTAFLERIEAFHGTHDTARDPGLTWRVLHRMGLFDDWRRVYGRGGTPFVPAAIRRLASLGLDGE